jgi:hypothetical protein
MIMCRMTRPSGNLQGAGVTGHTLKRTVSDLMCARRPFGYRYGEPSTRYEPVLACAPFRASPIEDLRNVEGDLSAEVPRPPSSPVS